MKRSVLFFLFSFFLLCGYSQNKSTEKILAKAREGNAKAQYRIGWYYGCLLYTSILLFMIIGFYVSQYFGWYAGDNSIVGYVFRHDGSGSDDGVLADSYARQDYRSRTDPCLAADDYRFDQQPMPQSRFFGVVFRQNLCSRPDEHAVLDGDATLVEERATEVDEHLLTHTGRFPESCIKWREHTHRVIQWLAPDEMCIRDRYVAKYWGFRPKRKSTSKLFSKLRITSPTRTCR